MALINEIVIIFLLSIGVIIVCARLRLPATVGFLITGILCGPTLLGVVSDKGAVDMLAEIGVVLLLFTIGMELSGEALARLRKPVFVGGALQIGVTVAVIAGLAVALRGYSLPTGVLFGYLAALSSSAIVLNSFQQSGQTNTPHGRLVLAILVLQDILFAPMLVSIPLLAGTVDLTLESVFRATAQITIVLGVVLLFTKYGLPRLMLMVVRTRLRELALLTTLGLCLGMAVLTHSLGLSLSLGAFLAGLMLARSEYSMNVIAGVLPYRDVFMSLFFISIGLLLDVNFLLAHPLRVISVTCMFILVKALLVLPAVYFQGYPWRTAILTALPLAQIGEFSFVLAAEGLKDGFLEPEQYQLFLAVSILSMMLTPGLIALGPRLAALVSRTLRKKNAGGDEDEADKDNAGRHLNHLLIVGFGVSGKHLARAAKGAGIDYVVLEMNPDTVHRYKGQEPIFYGDASQASVLEHLNIGAARVMAIVISDPAAVRAATLTARELNPKLHIIARTRFLAEVGPLRNLGANEVIAEEFESSLEIFSRALENYLVPRQDITNFVAHIRAENYDMTRKLALQSAPLETLIDQLSDVGVQAARLEEGSELAGKSLAECALRQKHGVTVVAIRRDNAMIASPDANTLLETGDVVYLLGEERRLYLAETLFGPATAALFPPTGDSDLEELLNRR